MIVVIQDIVGNVEPLFVRYDGSLEEFKHNFMKALDDAIDADKSTFKVPKVGYIFNTSRFAIQNHNLSGHHQEKMTDLDFTGDYASLFEATVITCRYERFPINILSLEKYLSTKVVY